MLAKLETIEQFSTAISLMRLGTAGLQLAFVFTLVLAALAGISLWRKDERLAHAARRGQYAMLLVTAFCCGLLYLGIFDGFYFVKYIRHVTENNESTSFKVAALWASQQGSLLFWCLILTSFSAVFAFTQRHNRTDRRLPAILLVLSIVQFFFFFIMVSPFDAEAAQRSSPFALEYQWMLSPEWAGRNAADVMNQVRLGATFSGGADLMEMIKALGDSKLASTNFAGLYDVILNRPADLPQPVQKALLDAVSDGNGMNPALHNYWVAIHPPMLYLGFVGFTIPFAWAVGSLISGEVSEGWLRPIRLWTMGAWIFLTVGIALGGLWAYEILGWGGYWAWDPVENASFIPWLTGTAFIHSVIVTERRGILRVWSFALIIITYCMTVIGTFLVRSGIINSVHAFGATGNVDAWFYGFIGLVFLGSLLALVWRLPLLKTDRKLDSLLSREGSFLLNNLMFLLIALVTLVITFWPWITEKLYDKSGMEELGQDAFVMINMPLFLVVLLLMGIGPALAWRQNSLRSVARALAIPCAGALVAALVNGLWLSGADLLVATDVPDKIAHLAALVRLTVQLTLWPICVFTAICVLQEFLSGARARAKNTKENLLSAMLKVTLANRRRYGGYIVHLGVLLVALGIYYSSLYQGEGTVVAQPGGYAVITDKLTGKQHLAYYAAESRTDSWDMLRESFGRDESRAQLYENMLRYVRRNPELDANQIVEKVQADMRAGNGGKLPLFLQSALPKMIAAVNWGVKQRENKAVYESFNTKLYVFPFDPAEGAQSADTGKLASLQAALVHTLRAKDAPGEDPELAQIVRDLLHHLLDTPGELRSEIAQAQASIDGVTDAEFAANSGMDPDDLVRAGAARRTIQNRLRAFIAALDAVAAQGLKLGVALPAQLHALRADVSVAPLATQATLFELEATDEGKLASTAFEARKELEQLHQLIEFDVVRLRAQTVQALAANIDDTDAWTALVAMRPLSLAGLLQAREQAQGAKADKLESEINAITSGAILLEPRMRIFYDKLTGAPRMNEPVKDPFYQRSLSRDLYFILQDSRPDGTATLRFFVKPHMTLGLVGLLVLVSGTLLAFLPSLRRRRVAT